MKPPVLPPRIPIYINNGYGRDTYISFYNGGFGNYRYSKSYKKDYYNVPIHKNHPDLFKRRPIDKYQMSGEGRDYFIYKGIQTEHDRISGNNSFEKILRKGTAPTEYFLSTKMPRNKFERRLINRIFYGKCPGLKERQMCPKVKFKKDFEKEKEKEKEENLINDYNDYNLKIDESKIKNNINFRNTFLKTNLSNEKYQDLNNNNNNDKSNLFFTPVNKNRKRKLLLNNNTTNQSEDLINSVRKIFLYNSKNKTGNESSE